MNGSDWVALAGVVSTGVVAWVGLVLNRRNTLDALDRQAQHAREMAAAEAARVAAEEDRRWRRERRVDLYASLLPALQNECEYWRHCLAFIDDDLEPEVLREREAHAARRPDSDELEQLVFLGVSFASKELMMPIIDLHAMIGRASLLIETCRWDEQEPADSYIDREELRNDLTKQVLAVWRGIRKELGIRENDDDY